MKKLMTNTRMGIVSVAVAVVFPLSAFAVYQAAPLATTKGPTFITEKSVRLNGLVNPNGMPDTKQWFEWGISGRSTVYETRHVDARGSGQVTTSADIVGLASKTQYFYRQVAENSRGKDVGPTIYFTTRPLPVAVDPIIIVETSDAVFIAETKAVLRGYASPHGDTRSQWWFQWGTSMKLENETPHRSRGGNSTSFEENLRELTPGTAYFFRAVGENSQGRVYGVMKMFVTLGAPPASIVTNDTVSEEARAQNVPIPDKKGDGQNRVTTTAGGGAIATKKTTANVALSPATGRYPGDFRDSVTSLFKQKPDGSGTAGGAVVQSAFVEASGPFVAFWSNLTGKNSAEVIIEKIGPDKITAHTPVEYRVTYAYRLANPAKDGKLKITLPENVIYIGDTTTNELLLEEDAGPERTYVLPLGHLEKGSTRAISILGMTTGGVESFPDVRARMEFVNQKGEIQVVSANTENAGTNSAALAGKSSGGFLPDSFLGWVIYVLIIAALIFGIRKAKAYYDARKKEMEEDQEGDTRQHEEIRFPGNNPSLKAS